jgi:hypothetical protein
MDELLKFASFLIHVENGRRRPGRSVRSATPVIISTINFLEDATRQEKDDVKL